MLHKGHTRTKLDFERSKSPLLEPTNTFGSAFTTTPNALDSQGDLVAAHAGLLSAGQPCRGTRLDDCESAATSLHTLFLDAVVEVNRRT